MTQRAFHHQRPLVPVACAFGMGILAGAVTPADVGVLWAGAGVATVLAALLLWQKRSAVWGVCALTFFLAALYVQPAAHPALPPEGKYSISAQVRGMAEQRATDGRVQSLLDHVVLVGEQGDIRRISAAYWTYYPQDVAPLPLDGQTIQFIGTVYHLAPQQNPYGFDFRQYLLIKGVPIGISGARELVVEPVLQDEPQDTWLRLRMALGARMDAILGEGSPVAKALLIGDRTDLTDEVNTIFRDGGIAHVLAVSGLHVGLLMAGILWLLGKCHASPKAQLLTVTLVLLAYCRLLDFSAPVLRAAILTEVLLIGRVLRKAPDPLTSLAIAFLLVLLLRPMDLFSIGFQLSFLAVLGIVLLGDRILHALRPIREKTRLWRVAQAYTVTVSATAFTALPSIAVFHRFSLIGLLVGPFACLAVGLLMYAYIGLLAVSLLWLPAAQTLAWPAIQLTRWFLASMEIVARLPLAVVTLPAPSFVLVGAWYLMLLMATRYVHLRLIPRMMVGVTATAAAVLFALITADSSPRYIQFSQGAADAAVIEDGAHTYVVDTGEHGGDLASYLLSRGRAIDTLYITHLHNDHLGGLEQLLEQRVPIGEIALPAAAYKAAEVSWGNVMMETVREMGIPVRTIEQGDGMQVGKVNMQVLWPPSDAYPGQAANRASLMTWWDIAGMSVLAMGDLAGDYEQYALRPAQVLKVAHHGAKDSTRPEMIEAVHPQLAIITTSDTLTERAQAVTQRLKDTGCPVLTTADSGAITLTIKSEGIQLTKHIRAEAQ